MMTKNSDHKSRSPVYVPVLITEPLLEADFNAVVLSWNLWLFPRFLSCQGSFSVRFPYPHPSTSAKGLREGMRRLEGSRGGPSPMCVMSEGLRAARETG